MAVVDARIKKFALPFYSVTKVLSTLLYFTLLYFTLLYFTSLYLLSFSLSHSLFLSLSATGLQGEQGCC